MAGMGMLAGNIWNSIEEALDLDVPKQLSQSTSEFYLLSILWELKGANLEDINIELLEILKTKFKLTAKLNKEHKKELFLYLIKRCLENTEGSYQETSKCWERLKKIKNDLDLSDKEISKVYISVHPPSYDLRQIKKDQKKIDDIMLSMTAAVYTTLQSTRNDDEKDKAYKEAKKKEFEAWISNNFKEIMPVLKFYGYKEFNPDSGWMFYDTWGPKVIEAWLIQSDKNAKFWDQTPQGKALQIIKDYYDSDIIITNINGELYTGPKGGIPAAEARMQFQQFLRTLGHLEGGIFEFAGCLIGGDKWADLGAIVDSVTMFAKDALEMQRNFHSISSEANPNRAAISLALSKEELAAIRSTAPDEQPIRKGMGALAEAEGTPNRPPTAPSGRPPMPVNEPMPATGVTRPLTTPQARLTEAPVAVPAKAPEPIAVPPTLGQSITSASDDFLKQNPDLKILTIEYKGKLTMSPSDANFLRFAIEWAQSEGIALKVGKRTTKDGTLRAIARRYMDRMGISRVGRQAMHPVDASINPFNDEDSQGTGYYFGSDSANLAFGGQLGPQLKGVKQGTRIGIRFVGFPGYDVAPPTAPPASSPDLNRRR